MIKEFSVPLLEGQTSNGPTRVRIFPPNEIPIEIGSLEKEAFTHVSDWKVALDEEGYGMVYRWGTKNIKDDEGEDAMLFLYFANPVATRGLTMTKEIANKKYEDLSQFMKTFTLQAHQKSGKNVITLNHSLPEWMKNELEEIINNYKK
jgi:hypothetical protein